MDKKLRLAILDDYQGLGGPHFAHLADRVEVTTFRDTLDPRQSAQKEALIQRLRPFEIVLAMRERTPFAGDLVEALPNLRLLLTTGMRNLSLDLDAFAKRQIPVAGTRGRPPGLSSTVQHTWALILALARHISRDDAAMKGGNGAWQGPSLATNLAGKTLALLGLGTLGAAVGKIAVQAFGMTVIAWSANLTQERADGQAVSHGLAAGTFTTVASKEELFRRADILSLHYVLSDRSRGIVGESELNLMKPTSLLINTSRGALIDEKALLVAATQGRLRGIALDVYETEPLPATSAWRTTAWGQDGRSDVVLSPHMGYGDEDLIHGWYEEAAEHLGHWLDGRPLQTNMY